jgi:DNA-binding MarR family transcriptional regulator
LQKKTQEKLEKPLKLNKLLCIHLEMQSKLSAKKPDLSKNAIHRHNFGLFRLYPDLVREYSLSLVESVVLDIIRKGYEKRFEGAVIDMAFFMFNTKRTESCIQETIQSLLLKGLIVKWELKENRNRRVLALCRRDLITDSMISWYYYPSQLHTFNLTLPEAFFLNFCDRMQCTSGYCIASSPYITENLGISKDTIKNYLNSFRKKGLVWTRIFHTRRGSRRHIVLRRSINKYRRFILLYNSFRVERSLSEEFESKKKHKNLYTFVVPPPINTIPFPTGLTLPSEKTRPKGRAERNKKEGRSCLKTYSSFRYSLLEEALTNNRLFLKENQGKLSYKQKKLNHCKNLKTHIDEYLHRSLLKVHNAKVAWKGIRWFFSQTKKKLKFVLFPVAYISGVLDIFFSKKDVEDELIEDKPVKEEFVDRKEDEIVKLPEKGALLWEYLRKRRKKRDDLLERRI